MCDFILFLKSKIRAIFEQEFMCSVFTFVQYTYILFFIRKPFEIMKKEKNKILWFVKGLKVNALYNKEIRTKICKLE